MSGPTDKERGLRSELRARVGLDFDHFHGESQERDRGSVEPSDFAELVNADNSGKVVTERTGLAKTVAAAFSGGAVKGVWDLESDLEVTSVVPIPIIPGGTFTLVATQLYGGLDLKGSRIYTGSQATADIDISARTISGDNAIGTCAVYAVPAAWAVAYDAIEILPDTDVYSGTATTGTLQFSTADIITAAGMANNLLALMTTILPALSTNHTFRLYDSTLTSTLAEAVTTVTNDNAGGDGMGAGLISGQLLLWDGSNYWLATTMAVNGAGHEPRTFKRTSAGHWTGYELPTEFIRAGTTPVDTDGYSHLMHVITAVVFGGVLYMAGLDEVTPSATPTVGATMHPIIRVNGSSMQVAHSIAAGYVGRSSDAVVLGLAVLGSALYYLWVRNLTPGYNGTPGTVWVGKYDGSTWDDTWASLGEGVFHAPFSSSGAAAAGGIFPYGTQLAVVFNTVDGAAKLVVVG